MPALVLRSKATKFMRTYGPAADVSDLVLDVRQIQRWSGCLGDRTNVVPIEGARHDVFLSRAAARERAYAAVDAWLSQHRFALTGAGSGAGSAAEQQARASGR